MELTKDIARYKLGEGELLYIPNWADDPDRLYEEANQLSFTPEIIAGRDGKPVTIKERMTVDYGAEYQYGKYSKRSIPWQPLPAAIRQKLEQQLGGRQLIQCACNRYPNHKGYRRGRPEQRSAAFWEKLRSSSRRPWSKGMSWDRIC
jgi:hypothetical protein